MHERIQKLKETIKVLDKEKERIRVIVVRLEIRIQEKEVDFFM
ncbi:hypothetical protein LEP1GSC179_0748 [Leptospira santarosai str. MOR084]|uniref:Uncharacterized protein n=1 Tax=Leptospira santarosai str. MOR084 TaxID=1049984 RepID=A0A0E2BB43_9LEPT|nr:hypothetical protein LEP1GSC179_0748 [Leptospira santarosai str. MOR084]